MFGCTALHFNRLPPTLAVDWWPAVCPCVQSWSCVFCWIHCVSLHLCCGCCRTQHVALWWLAEEGSVWLGERSQRRRPGRWADAHPHKIGSEREHCQNDPPQTGTAPESSPVAQMKAHTHITSSRDFKGMVQHQPTNTNRYSPTQPTWGERWIHKTFFLFGLMFSTDNIITTYFPQKSQSTGSVTDQVTIWVMDDMLPM